MNTNEAMRISGQHQSSSQIGELVDAGQEIKNLWTNEKPGDWGLSVVEFANGDVYVVDNGSCSPSDDDFNRTVKRCK
jgi:hypothetical protein